MLTTTTLTQGASGNRAFLWEAGAGMIDLNTLLPTGSGWTLIGAYALNDAGQIVGTGVIDGEYHAFLLTPPVPEPASFALFGLAAVTGLALRRRRKRADA